MKNEKEVSSASVLKEISIDHPYYCSDSNYYSNEGAMRFETMTEFLDEFESADIDMNLCFRWDLREKLREDGQPSGQYEAEVFLILQRKGIFRPCSIASVTEQEAVRFKDYALMHMEVLQKMWSPLWSHS